MTNPRIRLQRCVFVHGQWEIGKDPLPSHVKAADTISPVMYLAREGLGDDFYDMGSCVLGQHAHGPTRRGPALGGIYLRKRIDFFSDARFLPIADQQSMMHAG